MQAPCAGACQGTLANPPTPPIPPALQVVLNVGGHRFTTTVTTLRNAPMPSLFTAMFSGRHSLKTEADGSIFIDRDGRNFADILNFLRSEPLQTRLVYQGILATRHETKSQTQVCVPL
jgi:hypothetical protein